MDTNLRVVGCISGQVRSLGIDTVSSPSRNILSEGARVVSMKNSIEFFI